MNYNRLIAYAFIAATMTGFTSCSDDDEPMPKDPDFPTLSSGAYVLNQGSYSKKIEGALNVIDYTTATIADDSQKPTTVHSARHRSAASPTVARSISACTAPRPSR